MTSIYRYFLPRWTFSVLVFAVIISGTALMAEDLPSGSCQASNSLSVVVHDKNVVAYIPKGSWNWPAPNIGVVNIEGKSIKPGNISTANPVNACASNSDLDQTVCTANSNDVYLISGTTLKATLHSAGSGMAAYLEGN